MLPPSGEILVSELGKWVLYNQSVWSTQRDLSKTELQKLWMRVLTRNDAEFSEYCNALITWRFWDEVVLRGKDAGLTSKLKYLGAPCAACHQEVGAIDNFKAILKEMFEVPPLKPEDLKKFL